MPALFRVQGRRLIRRQRRAWPALRFVALLVVAGTSSLHAQAPGVVLKIGTAVLEVGEVVDVRVVCTNTGRPGVPEAVVPEGLELKLLNPTPSFNSRTRIINGRRSSQTTYTFQMQLAAMKAGIYTLGPITVKGDKRQYQTKPVRIVVRDAQIVSIPRGDSFVYTEMNVSPQSMYVTESYRATLTIGIRKVEIGGRNYDLNLLRDVLDGRSSQLSVFADGTASQSEAWLTDSAGIRHRYAIFRVTKQLRAEAVGDLRVGPIFLKLNYPTALRRGFFGRYEITRRRRETARADAIIIQVKAPPMEGRPNDYTGAIGRYSMKVSAKPTRVEQGQPITLAMAIRGNPLDGIAGPNLTANPKLISRFDFSGDELLGDIEAGAKVFRSAIFPKQTGEQTVPALSWSFFDPRRERYVTLTSDPIEITVEQAAAGSTPLTANDTPKPKNQHTTLTLLQGGISPNFTNPDLVLADRSFVLSLPWLTSLVAAPVFWALLTLTSRHRARLRGDVNFARRRKAYRRADLRINHALRNAEAGSALHGMAEALTGYVADRYGLGTGALTPADVRCLLADNGLDDTLTGEITDFLEVCDAAKYTPIGDQALPPQQAAGRVRRWIKQIERSR